jgi:microcin C transport system substrate-binding protein
MEKLKWIFIGIVIAITAIMIIGNQMELTKPKEPQKLGQLTLHTSEFPMSFNYYVNNAADAAEVFELIYDSLMELDPNTLEFKPLIAEKWSVSPDKKTFTIEIDPRAKWADGKPITTADVKFTYDTIMEPKNLTSVMRLFISRFNPPQVIDERKIIFTAKTVHYNNLVSLAGFSIIPKHLFEGKDFNKAFNLALPPGSGPYTLSEVKEGRYYTLTRRKDYWADVLPHHRATYNFAKIKYKVMSQDSAFEAFKKGDFDIYDEINPKRWVKETNTEHFKKNWIVKQKIYNYAPRGFYGLALNIRNPIFADSKVRKALFYLLDREYITKTIRFNQEKPLSSYWRSLYGSQPSNYEVKYNPQKAKELLQKAGYWIPRVTWSITRTNVWNSQSFMLSKKMRLF